MPESTAAARGDDSRSAMARASDARPFKPYVYRGETEEPPAVVAARERYRAQQADLEALVGQDPMPGREWYRELADGDELAETAAARDRYQDALAAVPEPPPPPVTAASRCPRCGYLTTAAGHRVMCGD